MAIVAAECWNKITVLRERQAKTTEAATVRAEIKDFYGNVVAPAITNVDKFKVCEAFIAAAYQEAEYKAGLNEFQLIEVAA